MKKLYLKNGSYLIARADTDSTGKYICIHEFPAKDSTGKLLYSIFSGNSATRQTLIFAEPQEEMKLWELALIVEIYENFTQYFNNLNQ